ncbi:MAG: hydroxyacid dehydrogenase, partial [Planctomycetes bacterium]|nr:hydroxyacid dehydrogenase [Planctomycetota bacterium]
MKILVADKLPEACLEQLGELASVVAYRPALTDEELPGNIADVGILIVRSTRVPPEAIARAKSLQMIVRAGAGVNTIAIEEASAEGIFVANCPGKNAAAVAELTFGLILALDRRIVENTVELRQGRWNKKEFSQARGLAGRTLGIIGLGQIGLMVARIGQSFGMSVVAWSRSLTPEQADELGLAFCNWPREVASRSDIVTVHCAATPATEHLINAEFFASMKEGAHLINTARGGIVDEKALAEAVRSRGIRAAFDVYQNEPAGGTAGFKSDLPQLPHFIGTHHIGASTDQAQSAIAQEVVDIVKTFLITGDVRNCVNMAETSPATWQLIVRHYDR